MRTSRLAASSAALLAVSLLAGCNDTRSPSATPAPTMSEEGAMTDDTATPGGAMTDDTMTPGDAMTEGSGSDG